jgi:hypothetical protein
MSERSCSIPLVVRLRGVPDEGRLAEMSETIARTVAGRLSEAAMAITGREGWNSYRATHTPPVVSFSGGSVNTTLQRRVTAAIEAGIARAVSNVSGTVAGSAPLPRPELPRSQVPSAAARPLLDPQETEIGWTLNGISVFKIQRPDSDAESRRLSFQPVLSINGGGNSRLQITVFRDANVTVLLQPDAVSQLTRLASEIDIRDIVTAAPPEDRPLALGALPSGATPQPPAVAERTEAPPSRPTREEFQQAVDVPLPAPSTVTLHPRSVASPLLPSPRFESGKIKGALPLTPNNNPERIDLPGRGLHDDLDVMPQSPDALSSGATDDQPRRLTGTPEGRRVADDEFTADGAFEEEQKQVGRIVVLKTRTLLTEDEFAAGVERARGPRGIILPYKKTGPVGSEASPIYVSRLRGGRVRVHLRHDIFATPYASDQDLRLPPDIGKGVELNETDVVGVKFLDEGAVSFFPALLLMHLDSEATRVALAKAGEAFAVGLTMGADTKAAAVGGVGTIPTKRRVDAAGGPGLAWANRIALGLDPANSRIQQHRGWVIETWPDEGRAFVSSMEQLTVYVQIHGLVDGGLGLVHFANSLQKSYQNWRTKANAVDSKLSEDDSKRIEQIGWDTEELLRAFEDIEKVAPPRPSGVLALEQTNTTLEKPDISPKR